MDLQNICIVSRMGSSPRKFLYAKNLGKYLWFSLRLESAYFKRNLAVICKYLYIELTLCIGGIMRMRSEYLDHKPQTKLLHSENPPN
jgi:hypothetical protein